ncbi:MAG: MFS transporter [Clostridia bacterium]|nr:MFS transporter [Clostridia bacterium]
MKYMKMLREMRGFLVLALTQGFSALGSAMTGYALIVWSYQQEGSALVTALLTVCSYAPYVLMSILAGALTDRWDKKRTLLVCDTLAALTTVAVLVLLKTDHLRIWHMYVINAVNGLMNTVQQPASEVSVTLLTPKEHYQQASAVQSFLNSVNNLLTPVVATAVLTLLGLEAVIIFDLITFAVAFVSLALMDLPKPPERADAKKNVLREARGGLVWLRKNKGILHLILFLAGINLTASMYNAALPALLLPRANGEVLLGTVNTVTGVTMLLGSLVASAWPKPKSRVRIICNTLLLSMGVENLLLALGKNLPVWCLGAFFGWIAIPLMNANLSTVLREGIPVDMQGRVWSARNTLQFFTIPVGYLLGGALVDQVFEPLMAAQGQGSVLVTLFGYGKGSGAAALFLVLWVIGLATCLVFRRDRHIWALEKDMKT